jgi:hypothetical protein
MRRLRALADRAGIRGSRAGRARRSDRARDAARAESAAADWERQRVRNDDSIVLDVRVGGVAFCCPATSVRPSKPDVLARLRAAPLVIVKAPASRQRRQQFAAVRRHAPSRRRDLQRRPPQPLRPPSAVVVARYRAAGARVFSTAEDGAVVIDTDGDTVVMWTATGRRERSRAGGR